MSYLENKRNYNLLKMHGKGLKDDYDAKNRAQNNLIVAHGNVKDTTFTVPDGYNFITFSQCGIEINSDNAKNIWSFFSNPYNAEIIDYIADYTISDTQNSYKNSSYNNGIFIDIAHHPYIKNNNIEMRDMELEFFPYFPADQSKSRFASFKCGVYSLPIGRDYEKGYCQYENDGKNTGQIWWDDGVKIPTLEENYKCGFFNKIPDGTVYNDDNYKKSLDVIKNSPILLSNLVKNLPPGTYFIMACRSVPSSDIKTNSNTQVCPQIMRQFSLDTYNDLVKYMTNTQTIPISLDKQIEGVIERVKNFENKKKNTKY